MHLQFGVNNIIFKTDLAARVIYDHVQFQFLKQLKYEEQNLFYLSALGHVSVHCIGEIGT